MPTQEVIDETAAAIREDAAEQARRESTYSPDIVPPHIGAVFTDGTAQYRIAQANPDGGWVATKTIVDEKGKRKEEVVSVTDEEYYNAMQAQIDAREAAAQQQPEYALNDEVTLRDGNGNAVRGNITADANEDGQYEVETESPINGRRVNLFTREELDRLRADRPDDGQPPAGGAGAAIEEQAQDGGYSVNEDAVSNVSIDGFIQTNGSYNREYFEEHPEKND